MRSRWMALGACLLVGPLALTAQRARTSPPPPPAGLFSDPEGLAIDPSTGTIFVADEDHHELFALRPDGALVARLASGPAVPVPGGS